MTLAQSSVEIRTSILFIIGSLDLGGAERHLSQIAPELRRRGWAVQIYCIGRRGVLAATLEAQGVPVQGPPLETRENMSVWYRPVRLVAAAFGLSLFLLKHRPRIVHFFLPGAYLIGGICSILTCTEVRVMSRRSLNDYQLKRPFWAWFEKRLHRSIHAALGNSEAVVRQLAEEGIAPAKLGLIYNGIDLARFSSPRRRDEMRSELGIVNDALVLIVVANLIPYKGHADLLGALIQIKGDIPSPWRILLVGRDDGIGVMLKKQAEQAGLKDNVYWLGSRTDISDLLHASDIGILCSHQEGFSNAVIEAMAAGLPMIVTDVGGNGEAVLDKVTGWVVPARNPTRLAHAIRLLSYDPRRRDMGALGRQRVIAHFSLDSCVSRYEEFYRGLLTGKMGRNQQ